MKKMILFLAFTALVGGKAFSQATTASTATAAPTTIDIKDAAKHVGEKVTVCDKITGGRYLDQPDITLVAMGGGEFPDSPLTLVILPADKAKFKTKMEEELKGKKVCVTGTITQYQDRPQIVLTDPAQIKVQ